MYETTKVSVIPLAWSWRGLEIRFGSSLEPGQILQFDTRF